MADFISNSAILPRTRSSTALTAVANSPSVAREMAEFAVKSAIEVKQRAGENHATKWTALASVVEMARMIPPPRIISVRKKAVL